MAFKLFERTPVKNSVSIEGMSVLLPTSGKEVTIRKLINDADKKAVDMNSGMADDSHKVKMEDGSYCNVGEFKEKYKALNAELETLKKPKEDLENAEDDEDSVDNAEKDDDEDSVDNSLDEEEIDESEIDADEAFQNAADDLDEEETEVEEAPKKVASKNSKVSAEAAAKAAKAAKATKNQLAAARLAKEKKANAKTKADALRNAHHRDDSEEMATVETLQNQIERGRQRYGSR